MKKRLPILRTTTVLTFIVLCTTLFNSFLLSQNANKNALSVSRSRLLTSLSASTAYYHTKVTSVDATGNSVSTRDRVANDFNLPPTCAQDQFTADFSLGAPDANTLVALTGDGAVILKPNNTNQEFSGTTVPSGWTSGNFNGTTTTVANGSVTVNGTHVYSNSSFPVGSSLEFMATYNSGTFQNVGFSADQPFNNAPWVTIGQGGTADGNLYARASNNTTVSLGSNLLGSPHRFRIQWNATSFTFYVDGSTTPAATINLTAGSPMFVQISDVNTGDGTLSVDWLRVTPYAASGSYTSRVFDQGAAAPWGAATWNATVPTGTSLAILVSTGNTAVPDGTWSPFVAVTNGGNVGGNSRYMQYRADLSTTNTFLTPELQDITIACNAVDNTPPNITNVVPTPSSDGTSATITWTTDELANTAVDYGTSVGSLTGNVTNASLVTSHSINLTGLTPGTTYYFRVTSADASSNPSTIPNPPSAPLNFTTLVPPCFTDQVVADFAGGTLTNTYIANKIDGEVTLKPSAGAEFTTLPLTTEWNGFPWSAGGTSTVSGNNLSVNGARFNNEPESATFAPGSVLEFVATFGAATFEHVGFAGGTDVIGTGGMFNGENPYAMFSTFNSTNSLYTRSTSTTAGASHDVLIPGNFVGAPHLYRIEWTTNGNFKYYVDGVLVNDETATTITSGMRAGVSDFTVGGADIKVDWIHVAPYATPGTFESRVYDAGSQRHWDNISWTADVPGVTSLKVSVHTGNTAIPDGSWSVYTEVSNGGAVNAQSQYIQYKAELTTSDVTVTPALKNVAVYCSDIVNTVPVVTTDPTDKTVCAGSGVSFTSVATGTPTPTVQWQVSTNGGGIWNNINGATNSTLSFSPSAADNGKQYRAVWTNTAGNDISSAATLTVNPETDITQDPSNKTVCPGSDVTFNVTATGTGLTYQWRKGGDDISGATNNSLILSDVTASDAGSYDVVVNGNCGTEVTSNAAVLTINAAPSITLNPFDQTVCVKDDVVFDVNAEGSGLTYQWRKNGNNITGATSSRLTLAKVKATAAGTYDVVVNGACALSSTSVGAVLTINELPLVFNVTGNGGTYNCSTNGAPVGLSGSQTGVNYQLKRGSDNIALVAGTGNPLNFGNQIQGTYTVNATNSTTGCFIKMAGSATITQQAGSVPGKPGIITPANNASNFCGGSSYAFNIEAVSGALSYIWTPVTGGSVVSNNGISAVLSFPAGFTSGTIKVQAVNNCGKSAASSLKLNAITKPVGINGPDNVTSKQTGVTFSVVNPDPNVSYFWTAPVAIANTMTGQGSPTISVDWGKNSATIKVRTEAGCGTSAYISKSVTVLTPFAADSKVDVTGKGIVEINVSPNPTNGKAWISFMAHAKETYSIAVRDVYGKLLLYKDGITIEGKNQAEIDISNKPSAVYFVTLINKETGQKTMKLIKGR